MDQLPERNTTDFSRALGEALAKVPATEDDQLQYYQRLVNRYFVESAIRGLYVFHRMGAGKSRLAVSICEKLLDRGMRVILLAAKALHDNFRFEVNKYLEALGLEEGAREGRLARYQFVSSNAGNMMDQLRRPETLEIDLSNTFIVIDEAHEFTNAVTNGAKNATALYHAIMESKEVRVLCMSGTPIVNDPYEFALACNMLVGRMPTGVGKMGRGGQTWTTLFGEDYARFKEYFISSPEVLDLDSKAMKGMIQNGDKFMNRIVGLVSYYDPRSEDAAKSGQKMKDRFPTVDDMMVMRVPMSRRQYIKYSMARTQELEEASKRKYFGSVAPPLAKSAQGGTSTYRVMSRQLSNYCYPDSACSFDAEAGSQRIKYRRFPERLVEGDFTMKRVREDGPKILCVLGTAFAHLPWLGEREREVMGAANEWLGRKELKDRVPGPGIIYSQFKESAVDIYEHFLNALGWEKVIYEEKDKKKKEKIEKKEETSEEEELEREVEGGKEKRGKQGKAHGKAPHAKGRPRYIILTGEQPADERTALLANYNMDGNEDGKRVALLIITQVAARGISTRGTTHVHLTEPYWNPARDDQVGSRADRLDSHMHLPSERRRVQRYMYLGAVPEGAKEDEPTTDEHLYAKSLSIAQINASFIQYIRAASIDCALWSAHSIAPLRCHMCSPTGETLFLPELMADMRMPNKCQNLSTKTVKARSIMIGNTEYKFYKDESGMVRLLHWNPNLGGYVPLHAGHADYIPLMEKVSGL
jgi:hypothetical protein